MCYMCMYCPATTECIELKSEIMEGGVGGGGGGSHGSKLGV